MKHIKFRILIIVWSSMILLFFAFAGILNIVLPSHFVSEAEDALEYEIDYQHYITNINDESEDDSSDYYEEDSNEESTEEKVHTNSLNGLRITIYPKNKYILFKQITAIMYLPFMKNRRIMIIGTMQNPMKTIRLCI